MSQIKADYAQGMEICLSWVRCHNGQIPARAISAGHERYVARGYHGGEVIPGKVAIGHDCCYIPYGGQEIKVTDYEVLVDSSLRTLLGGGFEWKHATNGNVPKFALVGGTNDGKPLYVIRGNINGEACAGKVFPHFGKGYLPHGGKEHEVYNYEVLCFNKRFSQ